MASTLAANLRPMVPRDRAAACVQQKTAMRAEFNKMRQSATANGESIAVLAEVEVAAARGDDPDGTAGKAAEGEEMQPDDLTCGPASRNRTHDAIGPVLAQDLGDRRGV